MDRDLQAFIAIAEERTLTAAATKIHLAQPSLTKKLRKIELEYGGALFERLPRGMELTRLGKHLYKYAKRIEREHSFAKEELYAVLNGHLAEFRAAAGPTFHLIYMSRVFERLRLEFPNTELSVTADANDNTLPKLLSGNYHCVVGRLAAQGEDEEIVTVSLNIIEHCVVAKKGHRVADALNLGPRDLAKFPWIAYSTSTTADHILLRYFRSHGVVPPDIAVRTTSFHTAIQLVCTGNFLMNAPIQLKPLIEKAGAVTIPVSPPIDRFEAGICVRSTSMQYPIVERFIELLRQEVSSPSN